MLGEYQQGVRTIELAQLNGVDWGDSSSHPQDGSTPRTISIRPACLSQAADIDSPSTPMRYEAALSNHSPLKMQSPSDPRSWVSATLGL